MIASLYQRVCAHIAALNPAIVDGSRTLSYSDLIHCAEGLARRIEGEVPVDQPIAIYLPRSSQWIAASLACLASGRACVPLDPANPETYNRAILEQAGIQHLITTEHAGLSGCDADVRVMKVPEDMTSWMTDTPYEERVRDLAFIVHTSGTTGRPKGVMLMQDALMTLVDEVADRLDVGTHSRLLHYAGVAFDSATLEWLLALTQGATLYLLPDDRRESPDELVGYLADHAISQAILPAALLPHLPCCGDLSLTSLAVVGDVCPESTLWQWSAQCAVFNGFGPTESTICTSLTRIRHGEPVGVEEALPSISMRILGDNGEPATEGELHIGGPQVSAGYWRQPELTRQAFYVDGDTPWYRSGDRVRSRADGRLVFLGRRDHQVKFNGQRIELTALEDRIRLVDGVRDVRVLVHEVPPATKQLVAFIVQPHPDDDGFARMRDAVSDWPAAQRPNQWHRLDALPLTPNGKVDRQALLAHCDTCVKEAAVSTSGDDPLASLVQQALGGYRPGEDEHFFNAGGHSIAMIQLLHHIGTRFDVWLSPHDFRAHPTLAGLRDLVATPSTTALPYIRHGTADLSVDHPLTPQQSAIWYMHQSEPTSKAYLAEAAMTVRGPLDPVALENAINDTIARHSIYRTVFIESKGEPRQRVLPEYRLTLAQIDRQSTPPDAHHAEIQRLFDFELPDLAELGHTPPVRFLLVRFGDEHHVLLHQEHHLIHDGWGANVFVEEVFNRYHDAVTGMLPNSPPPPVPQYLDFALAQQHFLDSAAGTAQLDYWRQQLADCPQGTPLFGRRSHTLAFSGGVERRTISRAHWQSLQERCAALGLSMFSYTASILLYCLSHYSDQDDVTLGSAFANRHWGNSLSLLGMMVNTVVLRQRRERNLTVRDWLLGTQHTVEQAQANDAYPFGQLVADQNPPRSGGSTPFFNVLLGFHDAPMTPSLPDGVRLIKDETVESGTSKFDLDCLVVPRAGNAHAEDAVTLLWEYRTDLYRREDILAFLDGFERLFHTALDALDRSIDRLAIQSAPDEATLLAWGQGPERPYDDRLFEERWNAVMDVHGSATALVESDQTLRFDDLDQWARQWVHRFREAGLGSGDIVALHLPRGNALVAATLGVWLVGGIVLVIEPDLPDTRRERVLERARPKAQVQSTGELEIDESAPRPPAPVDSHTAYLIFTSGSTGEPKGVAVSHSAFANLCAAHQSLFSLSATTRGASLTTPGFDAYLAEVWPVLLAGGCVISLSDAERGDWTSLEQRLRDTSVTHLCFSTGLFEAADVSGFQWPETLQTLLIGGDRLGSIQPTPRPGLRRYNMYGPTETTVDALAYALPDEGLRQPPPIGRPIANARAVVIGRDGRLAPAGVEGELWIGGTGVAQGYLGAPDQTRERFVDGTELHPALTGRFYRTGDRATWSRDGFLVFGGRQDDEIKVRGYRVDLSEIVAALQSDHRVAQAACRYHQGALLAYAVPTPETRQSLDGGESTPQKLARRLNRGLRLILPDYMRPNSVMILDDLPLTRQGKVDKAALPLPLANTSEAVPAQTPLELDLVTLWQSVLERDIPSVEASFFALGGHSLLAMTLQSRIRDAFDVDLTLDDFFNHFTIRDQARFIDAARASQASDAPDDDVFEEGSL